MEIIFSFSPGSRLIRNHKYVYKNIQPLHMHTFMTALLLLEPNPVPQLSKYLMCSPAALLQANTWVKKKQLYKEHLQKQNRTNSLIN